MIDWVGVTSKRTAIGVDVGASGIRAVQLCRGEGTVQIESAICQEHGGATPDLGAVLRSGGFHGREIALGTECGVTHFYALEVPDPVLQTGPEEAAQVVGGEVSRLMSCAAEEVETRYWVVPRTGTSGSNVIGVGVPRSTLEVQLAMAQQSGFRCRLIDVYATALPRLAAKLRSSEGKVCGILDLGEKDSRLVVCVDDIPVLIRRLGAGGAGWTQRIAETLQISTKAAEVHKRRYGIVESRRGTSSDPVNVELQALIFGTLRAELMELAAEIKRSFEYVLSCYPSRSAGDLLLVGGGALMSNLPEYFSSALGIQACRASAHLQSSTCSVRLSSGVKEPFEVLALAAGLVIE